MRKKSHISLANHIVKVSGMENFDKHRKAFYIGSILPDCRPSFLTKRHEITETFDLVESGIEKLTEGYTEKAQLSTMYFTKLGEVIHYIADYFTFPHNKEYTGNLKEHCVYEGELKHKLRTYIKTMDKLEIKNLKDNLESEEMNRFNSVADICQFLKEKHRRYIEEGVHSVEDDCRYIVAICRKIALAIVHLCMVVREVKGRYAIAY